MSAINVLKFGGSSVSNNENLKIVANKILKIKKAGIDVVVVVSAQGKRTDELIKQVEELNKISRENQIINEKDNFLIDRATLSYNKREIDSLLTIGEQESASKLSILLNEMGYKSIALNALQAGIFTNSDFGKAKIIDIDTTRILKELENNKIVIVTGFQGIDKEKNFTTLGRGGSDTSAVALAIKLNAEKCYIFSDVDGVYNADPNIIKNAKKLKHISYSEMENASSEGAKVLCERSISLADKYNMKIIAKSTFNDNEGTVISSSIINDNEGLDTSSSIINDNEGLDTSSSIVNDNEGLDTSSSTFNETEGTVISNKMDDNNGKENGISNSIREQRPNLKKSDNYLETGMEHYNLEMCIKNDKLFKADLCDVDCEKLNIILSKINKQNIKIKNLSMQSKNNVIFIVNEYFKNDIKNIFEDENINAKLTKISEISFIGTGISNNGEILSSLYKTLEKNKYNIMNDVLNFEMHANVISIFFNKIISNDVLNDFL